MATPTVFILPVYMFVAVIVTDAVDMQSEPLPMKTFRGIVFSRNSILGAMSNVNTFNVASHCDDNEQCVLPQSFER